LRLELDGGTIACGLVQFTENTRWLLLDHSDSEGALAPLLLWLHFIAAGDRGRLFVIA